MTVLKRVVVRDKMLNVDDEYQFREVIAEMDDIFERGKREIAEGKEAPFREYIRGVRARLNENKL